VFPILLPALRDRPGDVPLLAEHFLRIVRAQRGRPARRFSPEAMAALCASEWQGNVRELRNAVETLALLADGDTIEAGLLPAHLSPSPGARTRPAGSNGPPVRFRAAVEEFEKQMIVEAIGRAGGSKAEAARQLG